jgi:hypothetical protein
MLSGDFEQVTRPQNKSHDVIDMDWNVSCEQYISTRHSSVRKENQFGNLKMFCFESWLREYGVNPPTVSTSHRLTLCVGSREAVSSVSLDPTSLRLA